MQFKEKVWTYLEREIRKVASNDSELMQKINEQTQIIPECLATTKVSNVVKQNDNLLNDHTIGCSKLSKIIKMLKKDLLGKNIHSTAASTNLADDGQKLQNLVSELEQLVDSQKTRLDLLEE